VRRLYDIANVLSSLRLLDKTQLPDSRKPAFRWRGCPAPGEVSAALAAGAGGARTPGDHLRALIDGAASEASHGADTGSPASVRPCSVCRTLDTLFFLAQSHLSKARIIRVLNPLCDSGLWSCKVLIRCTVPNIVR
jgi:E2F/DP family winged-helix DNA-binding domain